MTSLSYESYKGARDYYPDDMRVRNYIFDVWKRVSERYGYEAYDTPLIEPIEVYAAKSGQELVNEQTYQFVDRGDRRVAIRPEMTPGVSRMIAARRQEIAYPARWYSIAQYMRYERPQRGREREFWQLNVDIFGPKKAEAEAEIIRLGAAIMQELRATDDMYVIKINNRNVINCMMAQYLELDAIQAQLMMKLFDRKNKIAPEAFRDQAIEIFGSERAKSGLQKIAQILAARTMADLPEAIRDGQAVRDVQELFTHLERAGVKNAIFDITLMRGLDYYTGTVFEFFDTHPENARSLFGGGRYDGMVGLFGVEALSGVGIAPGFTMTELFLKTHKLLPEFTSTTDIYIAVLEDALKGAHKVADSLRSEGLNVELDITGRKFDRQIKTALKKNIPYVMFVSEDDLKKEVYPLKTVATSKEEKLSVERIVSKILDRRRSSRDELDDLLDEDE